MPRRMLAVGIASLVVGVAIGVVAAQPGCIAGDAACVRLPIVRAAGPSCEDSAPPTGGANTPHTWMTRYTIAPGEPLAACAYIPISPTSAYTVLHLSSSVIQGNPVAVGDSGIVTLNIPTAALPSGELIAVGVIMVQHTPGDTIETQLTQPLFVLVREPAP
jgi:hypothetical protein